MNDSKQTPAVEMPGPWKEWKTKGGFPTLPTAPWKSRKPREISTFPQRVRTADGKVENQPQVSHFPTRGSATSDLVYTLPTSDAGYALAPGSNPSLHRKETHTLGPSDGVSISGSRRIGIKPHFQAHRALESNFGFRLICGLENA